MLQLSLFLPLSSQHISSPALRSLRLGCWVNILPLAMSNSMSNSTSNRPLLTTDCSSSGSHPPIGVLLTYVWHFSLLSHGQEVQSCSRWEGYQLRCLMTNLLELQWASLSGCQPGSWPKCWVAGNWWATDVASTLQSSRSLRYRSNRKKSTHYISSPVSHMTGIRMPWEWGRAHWVRSHVNSQSFPTCFWIL